MFGVGRCAEGLYRAGLALLLFPFLAVPSQAEAWPQRPVKFIVTLGPGSGVDFGTRLLGDRLSKRWGQPVIIENRPGGDAVVAVTAVISANDDQRSTRFPYIRAHGASLCFATDAVQGQRPAADRERLEHGYCHCRSQFTRSENDGRFGCDDPGDSRKA